MRTEQEIRNRLAELEDQLKRTPRWRLQYVRMEIFSLEWALGFNKRPAYENFFIDEFTPKKQTA